MDPATKAMTNRSLRTIKTELEFLLDSSAITQQAYDTIVSQLPDGTSAAGQWASKTPTPVIALSPVSAFDHRNSYSHNEKAAQAYTPAPEPEQSVPPPPAYGAASAGPPPLATVTALYAFNASDAGDLALLAGDKVAVLEYTNAEWWKGRNERTGVEGIFPRSYVKIDEEKGAKQGSGYGNMPLDVSEGGSGGKEHGIGGHGGGKVNEHGKKFGKKLGNAAIFGAGATIGGKIVNGIF